MKIAMKKILLGGIVVVALGAIAAFALPYTKSAKSTTAPEGATTITWMTWDEAMKAMEKQPKKVFVDMYTDWCGWCKRMDETTFADAQVAQAMSRDFYCVKFNAEGRENIDYNGHTFKFVASGSRGVHELACALLDGKLGYPSYVYLNEKMERITVSPGYKPVDAFMKEISYIAGEHYKTTAYEEFQYTPSTTKH